MIQHWTRIFELFQLAALAAHLPSQSEVVGYLIKLARVAGVAGVAGVCCREKETLSRLG
jgi:hypothetical protein